MKFYIYYYIHKLVRSPYYHIFMILYVVLLSYWLVLHSNAALDGFLFCQPLSEPVQIDFNIEKQGSQLEQNEFEIACCDLCLEEEQNLANYQTAALIHFAFWSAYLCVYLINGNIR